jgi:hypothetical protein
MKAVSVRRLQATYIPATLMLAMVAAASLIFHVRIPVMTADPTATARLHPLTGIISNLGVLLWCAAASICAFAAMALRQDQQDSRRFLLSSAMLTAYLMLDDLFLFHEHLAPRYLGLNERFVYAALGIAVGLYLITFMRVILRTNFIHLLLAVGFLGGSVVLDTILEPWLWRIGQWEYFLEDGAKWLGIASWCSYYVNTSFRLLTRPSALPVDSVRPRAPARGAAADIFDRLDGRRGRPLEATAFENSQLCRCALRTDPSKR